MSKSLTIIRTANPSVFGMPARVRAMGLIECPATDVFGATEGVYVGLPAWRPPVC